MCKEAVFKDPFTLKYCPYRYITQEMCEKAVDAYLLTSKFVPDWFVTPKVLKILLIVYFLIIWTLNMIMKTLMITQLLT